MHFDFGGKAHFIVVRMHQSSARQSNQSNLVGLHNQQFVQKVVATWTCLEKGQAISTRLPSRKGIVIAVI